MGEGKPRKDGPSETIFGERSETVFRGGSPGEVSHPPPRVFPPPLGVLFFVG